jgi:ribonuclease D
MSVPALADPVLITHPNALHQLVEVLSQEPIVAVDTESNSLYAYKEQVCLIQFSTPDTDYLVDPLILVDVSPLAPIFSSPKIEKVFHAAEYDIVCMKRDFGFCFANLFDTMIAARVLGRIKVGLGSILAEEFNVHLEKRFQRADWGQRPLPAKMLSYARLDTHYLIPLRNDLYAKLKTDGRWALAMEDFNRLPKVNTRPNGDNNILPWRINGAHDLNPQGAAVLQELCIYRDDVARTLDRPLFKVMGDKTLLAIAESLPKDYDELGRLPGMSKGQVRRHGKYILKAIQRGLQSKPIYPPRHRRPNSRYLSRVDALRIWRKETARTHGVESDVILPRDLMHIIAKENPEKADNLACLMEDTPARFDRFGVQIIDTLQDFQD